MSSLQTILHGLILAGLTAGPAALAGMQQPSISYAGINGANRSGSREPALSGTAAQRTTVSISSPLPNTTVTGIVTVQASASSKAGILGVQIQLDGASLGPELTTPPYAFAWNTNAWSGRHTLTAVARDQAGKRSKSGPVPVTVIHADTIAPVVSITSPANGSTVSGSVMLTASASDNVGVTSVQFRVDGVQIGVSLAAPYSAVWNTSGAAAGAHSVVAVASDAAGNLAASPAVALNIADVTPPVVSITSPANGSTVSGSVMLTASASDNVGVTSVQFRVDGVQIGVSLAAPYSVVWNASGAAAGAHSVVAVAGDAAGNLAASPAVALNIADVTPPVVSITAPRSGATVSGTVVLSASATDNAGVAGVQFLVNGTPLGAELLVAPYNLPWNTTLVADGTYSISARARDTSGNYATSVAVSVNVSNTVPAPAAPVLASPADGATGVAANASVSWGAVTAADSYEIYLGSTTPPLLAATTASTSYTPPALSPGTKYYWYVAARNAGGATPSGTASFTTAPSNAGGGSTLSYASPYCGPSGGSTAWACGAWPSTTPPALGPAGTTTIDADTRNRVLRVTQPGSFGEDPGTAFKAFDGGWRQAWNADSTRFFAVSWSGGPVKHAVNWVGFDPGAMSLSGAGAPVPYQFNDLEWDQTDPDLIVGLVNGTAKAYNVSTTAWTTIFDPATTNWGGTPWISGWGGNTVCIAAGPQDTGYRIACHDRQANTSQVIDLHAQTINGAGFTVYFQGNLVTLPSSVGVHTITMAPDGKWLAIDTHGNSMCSIGGLNNYASTALFINLETNTGYEWNAACGGTHWAYGYNSVMMQSVSPKWTSTGASGPCNSDSRGVARRNTDATIDSSYYLTGPCSFFSQATWNVNVHLSWTNNVNDGNANSYPVLLATSNEGVSNSFLWSDIAAMETSAPPYQGRLWRFAQTWNDQTSTQCGFLIYSSPSISRNGKWAIFPSDWRGQTGPNGVCANGRRTDLFLFELK